MPDSPARQLYLNQEEREALAAAYAEGDGSGSSAPQETAEASPAHCVRSARLSAADRRVAATLKRHLADVCQPVDVRLFGSRVRGDGTRDSDLDIFIELETATAATRRRIGELAWEIGFAAGLVIAPFVVARDDIEHGPVGASPIIRRIMAEGVPV
jgi:hypothetical protein